MSRPWPRPQATWPTLGYILVAIAFGAALTIPFVDAAGLVEADLLDFDPGQCGVTDFNCALLYEGFLRAMALPLAGGALYGLAAALRVGAPWWRLALALPIGSLGLVTGLLFARAVTAENDPGAAIQNFIGSFVPIQDWAFVVIQFAVVILPTAAVYTAVVGLVAGAGERRALLAGFVAGIVAAAAFVLTVTILDQVIGYHIVGMEGQKVMPRIATLGLLLTGFLGAAAGLWLLRPPGPRLGPEAARAALRSPVRE
jgi:hypothetical protein